MDHVLAEHGLRLTYLCDANAIDEVEQDRILDDLSDDGPDGDPLPGSPDTAWPITIIWSWSPIDPAVVIARSLELGTVQPRARTSCCSRRLSSPRQLVART